MTTTIPSAKVTFSVRHGLRFAAAEWGNYTELHITAVPEPGEHLSMMLGRIQRFLDEERAVIVRQQVFGRVEAQAEGMQLIRRFFRKISWPVTWVEGIGYNEGNMAGMHLLAIAGADVSVISNGREAIGTCFEDGFARHLWLGKLAPTDCDCGTEEQTAEVYEAMESALDHGGMTLQNVVRTWFFLDGICSWYDEFNRARALVYNFNHLTQFPASTGIGTRNACGGKLVTEAWAVQSLHGEDVLVQEVASPLQCPAPKYGSRFSRATEVITPVLRRLTISGTASIAPDGCSAHRGDIAAQIDMTFNVINAMLQSRGLGFNDTSRMTAYFKDLNDASHLETWHANNGIGPLPVVIAQAEVCRPELLFEVEMDALAERTSE